MVDTVSIALSGLMAQGQRLAVAANNIANINTSGVLPTAAAPSSTVYKPLSVSQVALMVGNQGGGVTTVVTEDPNGYSPAYDPQNIYANSDGLIAVPNIDLAKEITDMMQARLLYKASISVLKTQNEMLGQLINSIT